MKIAHVALALIALALPACEFETIEREIGYKGVAKANPWLALERFCASYDWQVNHLPTWRAPQESDAMCIMPASLLNNETYVQAAEKWTSRGGHMLILIDHAESYSNDWSLISSSTAQISPALEKWFDRNLLSIERQSRNPNQATLLDNDWKLQMISPFRINTATQKSLPWVSQQLGNGLLTVISDGAIFRNRWLGDHDHAAFLKHWLDATPEKGNLLIYRSGKISLWELFWNEIGLVLIAGAICLVIWLWMNLKRFGPIDSSKEPDALRGFDQHLEATGYYFWRVDRAAEMMKSVRDQVLDRIPQKQQQDAQFKTSLAEKCELSEHEIALALSDHAPKDITGMTRKVAALQKIHHTLNP